MTNPEETPLKIYREALAEKLRISPRHMRRLEELHPPDGRDKKGHYWLTGPELTRFIKSQRRPERKIKEGQ